jgi:hypothetical protein
MNWNRAPFPSSQRRGGCAVKKISRSDLSSRRRGGQTGEIFKHEHFRRTDHPVCGGSAVLKDLIEHHAEEEEKQMFPKARKSMGTSRLREVGEELQERKEELKSGMWGRAVGAITGRRRVA